MDGAAVFGAACALLPQPISAELLAIQRELAAHDAPVAVPIFTMPHAIADIVSALYFVHTGASKTPAQIVVPLLPIMKRVPEPQRKLALRLCKALSAAGVSHATPMATAEALAEVFLLPPKRKWGSAKEKRRMHHSRIGVVLLMIEAPELVFFSGDHDDFTATFGDSRSILMDDSTKLMPVMERWQPAEGEDDDLLSEVVEEERKAAQRNAVVSAVTRGRFGEGKHRDGLSQARKDHEVISTLTHHRYGDGRHRRSIVCAFERTASLIEKQSPRLESATKGRYGTGKHRMLLADALKHHAAAEGRRLSVVTKGHYGEGKHRASIKHFLANHDHHASGDAALPDCGEEAASASGAATAAPSAQTEERAAPLPSPPPPFVTPCHGDAEGAIAKSAAAEEEEEESGKTRRPPPPVPLRHKDAQRADVSSAAGAAEEVEGAPVLAAVDEGDGAEGQKRSVAEEQQERLEYVERLCAALEAQLFAARAEADELRTQLHDSHFLMANFGAPAHPRRQSAVAEIATNVFTV